MRKDKYSASELREAEKNLDWEEVFKTPSYTHLLQTVVEGATKQYGVHYSVQIIKSSDSYVAYTDGNVVTINLYCDWIKNEPEVEKKHEIILGLLLHETGHLLFTDFVQDRRCSNALKEGRFVSGVNAPALLQKLADVCGSKLTQIYHNLANCIEDGYIEKRLLKRFAGYGEDLALVRGIQRAEDLRFAQECAESRKKAGQKENKVNALLNLTLDYAKFGDDTTGAAVDDVSVAFRKMMPFIEAGIYEKDIYKRRQDVDLAFCEMLETMKDLLKKPKQQPDEQQKQNNSGEKSSEKSSGSGSSGKQQDDSEEQQDSSEEKSGNDSSKSSSKSEKSDEKDGKEDSNKSESSKSEGSDADGKDGSKSSQSVTSEKEDKSSDSGTSDDDDEATKALRDALENADLKDSEERTHHGANRNPQNVGDSDDGQFANGMYPPSINNSLKEATLSECKALSRGFVTKQMLSEAQKVVKERQIDKGRGCQCEIIDETPSGHALYEKYHRNLDILARRVAKDLDKVIRERERGGYVNELWSGTYLDTDHAYRKDGRIMMNKVLPEDAPDMEVCVLVDCSGSMQQDQKYEYADECAYLTWKFCQMMQVRCSVYGHTTFDSDESVKMLNAAHPSDRQEAGERIFAMSPRNANIDDFAIHFCGNILQESGAASKMLFIISDGEPCGGHRIVDEMRSQVARFKKLGISVVTAGIDGDAKRIQQVYLDGPQTEKQKATFLDYSDMRDLPKAFAKIIRKELL